MKRPVLLLTGVLMVLCFIVFAFSISSQSQAYTFGALTATTVNKVTITQPATSATLTVPDGVTLNAGTGGTLGSNAFNSTAFAALASPTFTGTVVLPTVTHNGKTTTYNSIATVSNGQPAEYATIDTTGLSAQVSTATLYTPTVTGMYRISAVLKITTTGTSPVAGPITITYTDGDGSVAQSQVMLLQSTTGTVVTTTVNNSTTTGTVNGSMVIYAVSGTAIQYAVAVSGTFGAGRYSVHLKLEAL